MENNNHFQYTWHLIKTDLTRYTSKLSAISYLRIFSPYSYSFKITFWYRIGHYLMYCNHPFIRKMILPLVRLIHQHNSYKTGIQLPFGAFVGEGLKFGHYSSVVINQHAKIGNYVTISGNGVVVGNNLTKGHGSPTIGDYCVLSHGCKILGPIELGDYCFVGVNSVVTRSFGRECVLGGVNCVLSTNGKEVIRKCNQI